MIIITSANQDESFFSFIIKRLLALFLVLGILSANVSADEPQHVRQSVRALGMGNAFVAVANDENALFYNPAGLNSVQQNIFEILTINGTIGQNIIDFANKASEDSNAAIGELVGEKLYAEVNLGLLSVTGPGWGYSVFGSGVMDQTVHNPTIPYYELTAYIQYGAIGGLAFDFLDEILDVGFNFKTISRNGISRDFHIVDVLNDNFMDELEDELETTTAASPDIGAIYHFDQMYNLAIKTALVVRNIGGMEFGSSGEIPMTVDIGVATESELIGFDFIMAADYVDILNAATKYRSLQRNLKLGFELGAFRRTNNHHAISFRLGRNGPYTTSGFSFNPPFIPIKIDYASWSEEVGYVAGKIEDKRHSLQLSFNF